MEDVTDVDYAHAKSVCKDFGTKICLNIIIFMFTVIHYCWLIYLTTFRKSVFKYMTLFLLIFLKKIKVKLDLLTDTDMFLMLEKDIRGGICHAIHRYGEAIRKYMKKL